jgi:hypothetical protein
MAFPDRIPVHLYHHHVSQPILNNDADQQAGMHVDLATT